MREKAWRKGIGDGILTFIHKEEEEEEEEEEGKKEEEEEEDNFEMKQFFLWISFKKKYL